MDKKQAKRKKKGLKEKREEDKEKVYRFLKNHRDEAFTEEEIKNKIDVDRVHAYRPFLTPGNVEQIRLSDLEIYYYWERDWGFLVFYVLMIGVIGWVILSVVSLGV